MNILGVSCGYHDASACILDNSGNILFAGHSERYSKLKHDHNLDIGLVRELQKYEIGNISYYEKPLLKQLRQLYSGQGIDFDKLTVKQILHSQLFPYIKLDKTIKSYSHHLSHAAAGFQTSNFDRATVVVIDAIGEWETTTIWGAEYDQNGFAKYKKLWSKRYPHSVGLFYSALTQRAGLEPNSEEYILMGMAAYGDKTYGKSLSSLLINDIDNLDFKHNLHIGVDNLFNPNIGNFDIAAGAQAVCEDLVVSIMRKARNFNWSDNLVYMGGVALNCSANRKLGSFFKNIWIMPNPGDAGSSLGAAALSYGKKINWTNAYLGHEITGQYPVNDALSILLKDKIVGVASGRAEFGPRALGNRSILADPRGKDVKDRVNEIKHRQKFRPFAPVILEEHVDRYFHMPRNWTNSRYMQTVATCRDPESYPAIIHADGSSRVQTVPKDDSGIRKLLEKWFVMTDCPMLLNTSLNIKGEPIVNDRADADRFEKLYGVKVVS